MSSDTTGAGILDSIDGALADWGTSKDAMRWVPEEERAEVPADDGPSDFAAALAADMARFAEGAQRMLEAMRPVVEAQVKAAAQLIHGVHRALYPKQHQRCFTCHPWRKPKPLAINGHEYHRRQRSRVKRKRRKAV